MKISEVAKKFDLTPATLRYYETMTLIPPVERDSGGIRDYSEEDLNWIEFIKCMRDAGIPVESLKIYTQLFQSGDQTTAQRKEILEVEREKLIQKKKEIEDSIDRLTNKIIGYEKNLVLHEKKLNLSKNSKM